jgi:hypothetical protein
MEVLAGPSDRDRPVAATTSRTPTQASVKAPVRNRPLRGRKKISSASLGFFRFSRSSQPFVHPRK